MLVVGDRESSEGTVSVRERAGGDKGAASVDDSSKRRATKIAHQGQAQAGLTHVGGFIAFDRSPRRDDRTRVNERIRVRKSA
jgi:hypothetical protein